MMRAWRLCIASLFGVLAFALVLTITDPPAPGLDPDAMSYLGAAKSLASEGRYQVPVAVWWSADSTGALAHFPPGFSTALAVPMSLGMEPLQAARLIEALAAAITLGVVVWLVAECASLVAAAALGLALVVMPAMHEVHVSVLSEPMFLACIALLLLAMTRPARPLALGVPAAVGVLTRYAGASLVGAAVVWAFAERGTLRERVKRAVVTALPAVVLQGAWVVRTKRIGGPAEIRRFAYYADWTGGLRAAAATTRDWLVPVRDTLDDPLPHHGSIALALAIAIGVLALRGWWQLRRDARDAGDAGGVHPGAPAENLIAAPRTPMRLATASLWLLVCYLGMLFVSRMVADPGIPFDMRLMAPAFLLASVVLAALLARWWRSDPKCVGTASRSARVAMAGALGLWWLATAAAVREKERFVAEHGSDFGRDEWRRSELVAWAREHAAQLPLYSNWPAAVWFYLHRPSHSLPRAQEPTSVAAFADTLRKRGGVVLEFNANDADYPAPDSLIAQARLRVVATLADGRVLAAR